MKPEELNLAQDEELPVVPPDDSSDDEFELTEYDRNRPARKMSPEASVFLKPEMLNEFKCPICLDLLSITVTTKECLHRFCEECITAALRRGNKECPTCRKKLVSRRSLRQDSNFDALIRAIFPDRQMFDKIDNLTIEAMSEWEKNSQNEVESEENLRESRNETRSPAVAWQDLPSGIELDDANSTTMGWLWQDGIRPYKLPKIGKWQREFGEEVEDEDEEKEEEMEDCRMGSTREGCKVESKEETDEESLLDELEDLNEQMYSLDDSVKEDMMQLEEGDVDIESVCSSSEESDLTDSEDEDSSEFESDGEEVVQFDVPFAALPSVQESLAPFNNSAIMVPDYLLSELHQIFGNNQN